MPVPTNQQNIHLGRADIWLSVTIPAEGSVVPLVNGQPTTGTFIGATTRGASFVYNPNELDLLIEQSTMPMDIRIITENVRLEFSVAEIVYGTLLKVIAGGFDKGTFVAFGGVTAPPRVSVLLVSPKRDGKFVEAMLYTAVMVGDRNIPFSRGAWSEIAVVARAVAVTTRTEGDQGGFVNTAVVSA